MHRGSRRIGRHASPAPTGALVQVAVRLPRATLRMLDGEAASYGWSRSQFLDALVWHKYGEGLRLEPLPNAPKYRFGKTDWETTERWIWYARPETKARLDEMRLRLGNIKPAPWIALALNEWVAARR